MGESETRPAWRDGEAAQVAHFLELPPGLDLDHFLMGESRDTGCSCANFLGDLLPLG